MNTNLPPVSPNTTAILLLTAPLIFGRHKNDVAPLTPTEYRNVAKTLHGADAEPSDLLGSNAGHLIEHCARIVDPVRIQRLLDRGFLLSQALEHWRSRAIWVVSRADSEYPRRLRSRVKEDAPPVLYGCGNLSLMANGGLAVVGSRNVDEQLTEYARRTGKLASKARHTLISGGARGIDQAAMEGAIEGCGPAIGVVADSLEKQVVRREYRSAIMNGILTLVSPYDPAAGFNVGNAMRRNKAIYALADCALVISSDYKKGGTWTGAVEQLEKLHYVPVFVRTRGTPQKGLDALHAKGAHAWPEPEAAEDLTELLRATLTDSFSKRTAQDPEFSFEDGQRSAAAVVTNIPVPNETAHRQIPDDVSPADELFNKVRELLSKLDTLHSEEAIASTLRVTQAQVRAWLQQLVAEGVLEKQTRPVRYRSAATIGSLFEQSE